MESISDLLAHRARDDSAKPFCFFAGSSISFGDLHRRVSRLTSGFAALGVSPGDRVAVMFANHPDHPMVFLALARLGLEYVLAHSEARAVVADERFAAELVALLPKSSIDLLVWRGTAMPAGSARSITLDDLAAA